MIDSRIVFCQQQKMSMTTWKGFACIPVLYFSRALPASSIAVGSDGSSLRSLSPPCCASLAWWRARKDCPTKHPLPAAAAAAAAAPLHASFFVCLRNNRQPPEGTKCNPIDLATLNGRENECLPLPNPTPTRPHVSPVAEFLLPPQPAAGDHQVGLLFGIKFLRRMSIKYFLRVNRPSVLLQSRRFVGMLKVWRERSPRGRQFIPKVLVRGLISQRTNLARSVHSKHNNPCYPNNTQQAEMYAYMCIYL